MEHNVEIRQMFDESFKRKVIEEYLSTGHSKMSIQRKYNIHFKSAICTWMKRFILLRVFIADVSRRGPKDSLGDSAPVTQIWYNIWFCFYPIHLPNATSQHAVK